MKQILDAITFIVFMAFICFLWVRENHTKNTAETLTCVRVEHVTPAGTIIYLCEVLK